MLEVGDRHRGFRASVGRPPTCTHIEFLPPALADPRLRQELCSEELPVVDGRIPLPTKPGLGVTIDENALATFRVLTLNSSKDLFMPIEAVDFFYLSMPVVEDIGDGSQMRYWCASWPTASPAGANARPRR